jgi:arylsulfatase
METVDDEVAAGALDFIDCAHAAGKPFLLWWNSTRMHVWTHLKEDSEGKTGQGIYADGLIEHDGHVGQILTKLDELGLADNTIIMYSTDNGAEKFTWPDGGTASFRGEKNSNREGGYRVPTLIKWPGVIESGTVINEIGSHEYMLPTLMAAVGEADIKERLKAGGAEAIGRSYKVHVDGYNLLPYLKGETEEWPRMEFLYWTDGGDLAGLRYNDWKLVFLEQRAHGMNTWQDPLTELRLPKLFNLRQDPFEIADHEAIGYGKWRFDRLFALVPAQAFVAQWLGSLEEFPPRQKPGSFSLSQVMEKITAGAGGGGK